MLPQSSDSLTLLVLGDESTSVNRNGKGPRRTPSSAVVNQVKRTYFSGHSTIIQFLCFSLMQKGVNACTYLVDMPS